MVDLHDAPPVATGGAPSQESTLVSEESSTDKSASTSVKPPKGRSETEDERQEREERKKQEEKLENLKPKNEDMTRASYGISLSTTDRRSHESVDMGGKYRLEEVFQRHPEFGDQVDFDRELYERLHTVLEHVYEWEERGDARFSKLAPIDRVTFEYYKDWRTRAVRIAEARNNKKDKTIRDLGRDARIFQSGLEMRRALAFLEKTEIIATHALGDELTNGGQNTLSYQLDDHRVDFLEKGEVPGVQRQAIHRIAEALHISDHIERRRVLLGVLTNLDAVTIGGILGTVSGNPLLGLAVGAGVGVAFTGAEIMIGNWVLSFPDQAPGSGVGFNLQFLPNAPGNPDGRITDDPIGEFFLGRGLDAHPQASAFLVYSEKTRHGIYKRLGLRVKDDTVVAPGHFTRRNVTINIPRVGQVNVPWFDFVRPLATLAPGEDAWMVNLFPESLTIGAGGTSDMHFQLRKHIQAIIKDRYPDLPSTQISAEVSYLDYSGLTPKQRHEVMIEAYNRLAADLCGKDPKITAIYQRLIIGGDDAKRAKEVTAIATEASAIKTGTSVIKKSEITEEMVEEEREKLAAAKDKITTITKLGEAISKVDEQISSKEETQVTAEGEYQNALLEQGNIGSNTGIIGNSEAAIKGFNADITGYRAELGAMTVGNYPANSINEKFYRLQADLQTRQMEYKRLDPADATRLRDATRARTPTADVSVFEARISRAEVLEAEIRGVQEEFGKVQARKTELEGFIREKETHVREEEVKIRAAERVVAEKKGMRDAADRVLNGLKAKRQTSIDEMRSKTSFTGDYGQEVYNTVLAHAQVEEKRIQEELIEKGIIPKAGETEWKMVSKEDRDRVEGMEAITKVHASENLNSKVSNIWTGNYDDNAFKDRRRSHEVLLQFIFGDEVAIPGKRKFYERLLSKAGVVDELFDYLKLDDAKATHFFSGDAEGLRAYRDSRTNHQNIQDVRMQIDSLESRQPHGWENQIAVLENRLHGLQDTNVRLLTDLYDRKVPAFFEEGRAPTAQFVVRLMDRMKDNALHNNPFADTVQFAEKLSPHVGPDGSTIIRPPDVNPTDGTWINKGGMGWNTPSDYQVNGQPVDLQANVALTNTGNMNIVVEMKPQNIDGMREVLPINRTDIAGTSVENELNRLGLTDHVYDGGNKRGTVSEMVTSLRNAVLPPVRPDMSAVADPNTIMMRSFLTQYGFEESLLDRMYGVGAVVGTVRNDTEADAVMTEVVNKQVQSMALRIQNSGLTNANDVATWLRNGSRYELGGSETERMFRSLARNISENTREINSELLGDRFNHAMHSSGSYFIQNDLGELRMYYDALGGAVGSISLQELLQIKDPAEIAARVPGLDETILNELLYDVGRNALEAMRQRTS